jgi:hypothetical protein
MAVTEEGQKLTKVLSPYVVQCYHVERLPNCRCLVLEYVPGSSLDKLHKATPLSVAASLTLIAQIAEGLTAIHARGLLHRDIKPNNIVVRHDGIPKLVDFGLAKSFGDSDLENVEGTYAYMSPEQARGEADFVTQRTDIFGLGATLYFLLTGRAPYTGTREQVQRAAREGSIVPPRTINPRVPADVNKLCMRCLAKAPENRFESARELADFIKHRRRRKLGKVVLGVGVLLVATITGYYKLGMNPTDLRPANGQSDQHQINQPTAKQLEIERDLARRIIELGAELEFRLIESDKNLYEQRTLPPDPFIVSHIKMSSNASVNDELIQEFLALENLNGVDLNQSGTITDAGARTLAKIKTLTQVLVRGANISDEGGMALAALPNLKKLNLSGTHIGDKTLQALGARGHIQQLLVAYTNITDNGLGYLRTAANLSYLDFRDTSITDEGLEKIANLVNVATLGVSRTKVTDVGLRHLRKWRLDDELVYSPGKITEAGIAKFRREHPDCKITAED